MKYLLLASCLLLTGCATMPSGVRNIREGMSKDSVINRIGQPDGVLKKDGLELLSYSNRMIPWTNEKADYFVVLKNNSVISYGTSEIRQGQSLHTSLIIPLTGPTPQPVPMSPAEYYRNAPRMGGGK